MTFLKYFTVAVTFFALGSIVTQITRPDTPPSKEVDMKYTIPTLQKTV